MKYRGKKLFKYLNVTGTILTYKTRYDSKRQNVSFKSTDCMLDYLQRVIIANLIRKIDLGE